MSSLKSLLKTELLHMINKTTVNSNIAIVHASTVQTNKNKHECTLSTLVISAHINAINIQQLLITEVQNLHYRSDLARDTTTAGQADCYRAVAAVCPCAVLDDGV